MSTYEESSMVIDNDAHARRRIGAVAVAILLATGSAVPASAVEDFDDIAGNTHADAIRAIAEEGVTTGYGDGTFRPSNPVTRGQMATFLTNALDLPPGGSSFDDIAGSTHEASIGALAASGITGGFPDGTYRPGASVTRGQMATFLARGFDLDASSVVRFRDIAGTTHAPGINATATAGIAGGYSDGTYRPGAPVTRGQMATFLARSLDLIGRTTPPPEYVAPPSPPAPEPSNVPLAPSGTTFGNGVADRAAGTYRSAGSSDGCYWARLSGTSGSLDDIIANEFTNDATIVTIAASDRAFESTRCSQWRAVQDTYPSQPASIFGDGSYVVGEHIRPGTYRNTASEGCYYARLSGFSGSLADIIVNNNTDNSALITISASDTGFTSTRCGTWTRQQ
jgi:hypothetical protein